MAVKKRDVVLMGKNSSGDTNIDMPITRLGNIEDDAEIKENPAQGDFIPIIDMADGGQMKKTPYAAPGGGGAGGSAVNQNLIDNPDFRIDQRGSGRYMANLYSGYSLDRWRIPSGLISSNVSSGKALGGANLSADPKTSARCLQYIDPDIADRIAGQTVTLSASIAGVLYSVSGVLSADAALSKTSGSMTIGTGHDTTGYYVYVSYYNSASTTKSILIDWIKLELGENATLFIPPDPALELLKCQRYCQALKPGKLARPLFIDKNSMLFRIPMPTLFRALSYSEGSKITVTNQSSLGVFKLDNTAPIAFTFTINTQNLLGSSETVDRAVLEITASAANHGWSDGVLNVYSKPVVISCDL